METYKKKIYKKLSLRVFDVVINASPALSSAGNSNYSYNDVLCVCGFLRPLRLCTVIFFYRMHLLVIFHRRNDNFENPGRPPVPQLI